MESTPKHLSEAFDASCVAYPKTLALMSSDGREFNYTNFGQLYADVCAWAKFLTDNGVQPGDRVTAIAAKCPNHFRFFYACWRIGAVAVPVCENLGDEEMSFVIKDAEPRIILTERAFMKKVTKNAGEIQVVDWATMPLGSAEEAAKPATVQKAPFESEDAALDSLAAFIYTSGSTGMPKGVMLTHRNLWWNVVSALEFFKVVSGKDRIMSLLPYWHAYALCVEVGCAAYAGCCCCIPHNIADFSRNIAKYKPTLVPVVPRIMDMLYAAIKKGIEAGPAWKRKLAENAIYNASRIFTAGTRWNGGIIRMLYHHLIYDPLVFRAIRKKLGGKLRMFISGGAPLDLDVQSFFSFCGMPVLQGYGLSETSPVVSSNAINDYRLGSCGKLMPWLTPEFGGDVTFKSEDGTMGKYQEGQLLVKGHCVMKGYWRHKDASAKTFEDGWLNTGDVGHLDKDGYLFIHGRNTNMIVLYGGEKLHPEYIEDAIKGSPLISEAMVFGEKCKNVYACVNVPEEEQKKHTPEELHKLVKAEVERLTHDLAPFQRPKDVLILPEFSMADGTMTATLKIRRFKIRQKYQEQIDEFLQNAGEAIATKKDLVVPSSRIVESLESGSIVVGVDKRV